MPLQSATSLPDTPKLHWENTSRENSLERLFSSASWLGFQIEFQSTGGRFSFSFNLFIYFFFKFQAAVCAQLKTAFVRLLLCGFLLLFWPISHSFTST